MNQVLNVWNYIFLELNNMLVIEFLILKLNTKIVNVNLSSFFLVISKHIRINQILDLKKMKLNTYKFESLNYFKFWINRIVNAIVSLS